MNPESRPDQQSSQRDTTFGEGLAGLGTLLLAERRDISISEKIYAVGHWVVDTVLNLAKISKN